MAFAPKTNTRKPTTQRDPNMKFPVPKAGNRPARVSVIVDLGNQNRKDYIDPQTQEAKPQAPADQIAIFLDLTSDVLDYGTLGHQPYRLMLNKSFAGEIDGINFGIGPVRDANGNEIKGRPWNYHPMSIITKLAKAAKIENILNGSDLDLEQLLNKPLMAQIEVKKTEDKKGTIDPNTGKVRVYENVNFRGVSEVPEMPDGSPFPVPPCAMEPRVISFDTATAEDVKFIRRDVLKKIKTANNYAGSQMQRAIEEYEAGLGQQAAPAKPVQQAIPAAKPEDFDGFDANSFDDDIPF